MTEGEGGGGSDVALRNRVAESMTTRETSMTTREVVWGAMWTSYQRGMLRLTLT